MLSSRSLLYLALAFSLLLALGSSNNLALAQTPARGFQATYFAGKSLAGDPLLTRVEPVVNWSYDAGGSPAPGVVPSTDFSTRWQGWHYMDQPGKWTFTYTSDDGGRVWVDNALVIDLWYDHRPLTRSYTTDLAAGYHLIRVEYYQTDGSMTSQLLISPNDEFPDWMGEYFDNPYLLGEPRYRVNDTDINFNWGSSAPDPRLPADNFSVRWSRLVNFAPGTYTFTATADDGIRVWVGDTLVIDAWMPQQPRTFVNSVFLSGTQSVRVEYFEQSGQAVVNLLFQPTATTSGAPGTDIWRGEYFTNPHLSPPAKCEQETAILEFNWGGATPGCDIAGQFYSARWTATLGTPATGFYTVILTIDDGARVFLDNRLILDEWREQPPSTYSTTVYLTGGNHEWRVEYFQGSGGAQIALNILAGVSLPSAPPAPTQEFLIDAGGAGWTPTGDTTRWQTADKGYENNAFWTKTRSFMVPASNAGRWYPPLTQPRRYEVFAYIPSGIATTRNARYWIFHNNKYSAAAMPQALYQDAWVSLGTFDFSAQGGEYVSLSDVTYEPGGETTIVWDAVKFIPR